MGLHKGFFVAVALLALLIVAAPADAITDESQPRDATIVDAPLTGRGANARYLRTSTSIIKAPDAQLPSTKAAIASSVTKEEEERKISTGLSKLRQKLSKRFHDIPDWLLQLQAFLSVGLHHLT
ncbi:hypothetical protein PHYSODRAFT_286135 [Phytophthora sojae]|uniref:RxLR effector protein n=2 Tax=Phytophthora sojae TaxID=67593 RepID=G4ZJV5_PHYSP|nr:hypothetical protein PHYSODRAFT_286135 [Phytophthora sojae]ABS50087.1 putative effector protein Avh171 [Phytophthora sojae]ADI72734.1 putative effector protein Avh171 [Phytophthora sojae]ADI72735.1 putative effector protein Avh171 [Phytophthora sojae]ADI72736.1 putative effector protein Avh171 [Phytophthora sojae]ADI72737.1 putative effector protein Avh171 [Phytophthora sojae]|eukprot:XP_009527974.1 hypothetical protein PHYSODRAFT_286135 [Phytophthora sojae]